MELIKGNTEFNLEKMHEGLMVYGYYCYHDDKLMNIVNKTNVQWDDKFGIRTCESATIVFKETQLHKFRELYPNLKLIRSTILYGIDKGADRWHTDAMEKLTIQALCYQEDFQVWDGGSLQIQCYDGIERQYYPKNGDVVIMNHTTDTVHRVDTILTDKKRVVLSMVFR
jgi:uncharacterized lipoprotein YehR (DUF1307 family)